MAKKKPAKKDWRTEPDGMPEMLYARQETFAEGREEFLAFKTATEAVEDDGPTPVGHYQLVKVVRLRKRVEQAKD